MFPEDFHDQLLHSGIVVQHAEGEVTQGLDAVCEIRTAFEAVKQNVYDPLPNTNPNVRDALHDGAVVRLRDRRVVHHVLPEKVHHRRAHRRAVVGHPAMHRFVHFRP